MNQGMDPKNANPGQRRRSVIEEMQNLLNNVYAELKVSRDQVRRLADQGRRLAEEAESWAGGQGEKDEYVKELNGLERKINQTLDLRRLKEEGLVKAVKL